MQEQYDIQKAPEDGRYDLHQAAHHQPIFLGSFPTQEEAIGAIPAGASPQALVWLDEAYEAVTVEELKNNQPPTT